MKASKFNILVDHPEKNEWILFNSLCGSLTVWEEGEIQEVRHILAEPDAFDNSGIKTTLVRQKYLVDASADEIAAIMNRKRSGMEDQNRLDVVIMPTLDCNFACVYCYESRRASRMTQATESAIRLWLEKQIPRFKVVMLHWFGGEPLMGYSHVVSISKHALHICSEAGVLCLLHITTNGYLLDQQRIKGLIEAGLHDYQITVDGPPETHDKLRVLRNGRGTFDRLFKNIVALARASETVKISLRVNFNQTNIHSIPKLLELFPQDIRSQLRVVYEPIFGGCQLSATDNLSPVEMSGAMAEYYKMAEQLGYDVVLGVGGIHSGRLVYCYAERISQFIINYNGDVYKCSVCDFSPRERVGYISANGVFVKEDDQWNKWVNASLFEDKCYSCLYLPLCMGGCRKMRLHQEGTGSHCSLVPTNTSYLLKQIALGCFEKTLIKESNVEV